MWKKESEDIMKEQAQNLKHITSGHWSLITRCVWSVLITLGISPGVAA